MLKIEEVCLRSLEGEKWSIFAQEQLVAASLTVITGGGRGTRSGGKQSNHRSDLSMNYDDPQSQDLEEAEDDGRTSKLPLKPVPLSIRMEEQKKRLLLPLVILFLYCGGGKKTFLVALSCVHTYTHATYLQRSPK